MGRNCVIRLLLLKLIPLGLDYSIVIVFCILQGNSVSTPRHYCLVLFIHRSWSAGERLNYFLWRNVVIILYFALSLRNEAFAKLLKSASAFLCYVINFLRIIKTKRKP